MNRREFLESLAALGFLTLPGGCAFAVPPGWKPSKAPNLVFGAISDTHLKTDHKGTGPGKRYNRKFVKAALECFKKANVDAVVHCGDFAHRGLKLSMKFHADLWKDVFGEKGGPVKLFVTGNHDIIGSGYGDFVKKLYPDKEERKKRTFVGDVAGNWQRIWGEPYEEVWHKEVKGYHFIGRHYGISDKETARLIEKNAESWGLKGSTKPFFYLQHVRPKAELLDAMVKWPNALGLYGHEHSSAANWHVVKYHKGAAYVQIPSCDPRDNGLAAGEVGSALKTKLEGQDALTGARQGYIVRVYDDMLVIERREFGKGGKLGPDWMMPLGKYAPHPFSRDELLKVIGAPQFRADAHLAVETKDDTITLTIPHADGNDASRVFAYQVSIASEEDEPKVERAVYAPGCNLGIGHEPNGGVLKLSFAKNDLPPGEKLTITVRPLSSLATFGNPLTAEFISEKKGLES